MTAARALWYYIETREYRLMRRVQRWPAPRWVRFWMRAATRMGDGWLWWAAGLTVLLFGGPLRYAVVAAGGLAASVGIVSFKMMKRLSRRRRPCEIEPHCWARVLPPDQYSFPSGHSITAFAIAIPFGLCYPHWQIPLLFLATSIAISRVILGMHFLSDVIVGALFGSFLGFTSYHLFF